MSKSDPTAHIYWTVPEGGVMGGVTLSVTGVFSHEPGAPPQYESCRMYSEDGRAVVAKDVADHLEGEFRAELREMLTERLREEEPELFEWGDDGIDRERAREIQRGLRGR